MTPAQLFKELTKRRIIVLREYETATRGSIEKIIEEWNKELRHEPMLTYTDYYYRFMSDACFFWTIVGIEKHDDYDLAPEVIPDLVRRSFNGEPCEEFLATLVV